MFCFLMVLKFLSSVINKTEHDNKHEQTNERQLKHNFLHVKQMCVVLFGNRVICMRSIWFCPVYCLTVHEIKMKLTYKLCPTPLGPSIDWL